MPYLEIRIEQSAKKELEELLDELKASSKFPSHFVIIPNQPGEFYVVNVLQEDLPPVQTALSSFNCNFSIKPHEKAGESDS